MRSFQVQSKFRDSFLFLGCQTLNQIQKYLIINDLLIFAQLELVSERNTFVFHSETDNFIAPWKSCRQRYLWLMMIRIF
jgi:hypothetical protein